jgi:hypothetical protein
MSTQLVTAPAALGLPTVDPIGLAMLCAVRFAGTDCDVRPSSCGAAPQLTVKSNGSPSLTAETVSAVLTLLQRNRRGLDDSLSDVLRGDAAAVEAVAQAFLFPAFRFIAESDPGLSTTVKGASTSMWSSWVRSLALVLPSGRKKEFPSVAAALEAAEKGLMSLDRLLCAKGARIVDAGGGQGRATAASLYGSTASPASHAAMFVLGTSYPTSADCFAYAAASLFLHADFFGGQSRDTTLLKWQVKARQQYALLLNYAESTRRAFFEDFAGTYSLKPIPTLDDANAESAVYKEGRWKTVAATVSFAMLYFVVVNAGVIVQLLGGDEGDGDEGEERSAESAQGEAAPTSAT